MDAPTGNLPTARLDVTTWAYHHEPPSAVDAALDRRTDRLFTIARAIHWTTAVFLVVVVLPAMLGLAILLPPVVLVMGSLVTIAASVITGLWHQQLRKHTGVPVIPGMADFLEPFANSMRGQKEAFELGLEERPADHASEDQRDLREFQDAARGALKAHRKLTRTVSRQFIIHGELAAQADRRGWKWLRDHHVRTIAKLVLQVVDPHGEGNGDEAAGRDTPETR